MATVKKNKNQLIKRFSTITNEKTVVTYNVVCMLHMGRIKQFWLSCLENMLHLQLRKHFN